MTIDHHGTFFLQLTGEPRSSFRFILARVGAICGYADGTLKGNGELERAEIQYLKAIIKSEPGSPLYLVKADLTIRTSKGVRVLRVEMNNNNSESLFLKIGPGDLVDLVTD